MPNTAKQEDIRKAWGVHYAEDIDENGWRESNVGSLGWDKEYFDIMKKDENVYLIRPKSLNGITTNNGWIRIESAKDFPEPGQYWVIDDDGDMFITDMEFFEDMFDWTAIRYYQTIVKPEKPIY